MKIIHIKKSPFFLLINLRREHPLIFFHGIDYFGNENYIINQIFGGKVILKILVSIFNDIFEDEGFIIKE